MTTILISLLILSALGHIVTSVIKGEQLRKAPLCPQCGGMKLEGPKTNFITCRLCNGTGKDMRG